MTDSATQALNPSPALPRSANLDDVEGTGSDLTEAKEAVVEGILKLAINRCTGARDAGVVVYGVKPSAKFVSGFLLPRFDASGQEDETSDIHIATMGIDLQVAAEHSGEIAIVPEFAIYVRLLPNWEELSDPRHEMMPRSELSRQTRQEVEDRARQYINEAIASLPPLDEPTEPDERPGDALAEAERAQDTADQADLTVAEQGDAELRGHSRAARASAERLERVAVARQQTVQQRLAARRERNAAIAAIRRDAFSRAFSELGIRLREARAGATAERALRMEDLATDIASEETQPDLPAPLAEAEQRETETRPPSDGEPAAVAADAVIMLRPDAGILDDRIAGPQPIPMKWGRFQLDLGEFRFDCHDEVSRSAATGAFRARILEQTRAVLGAWIELPEGQRDAYRPKEQILPSQFASKAGWDRYLDELRIRRPAVLAEILPDLSGVELVLDADPDFIDPTRVNLRAAIENGAQLPSRQAFQYFEPSLFQVSLQLTLPATLHRPLRLDRVQPSYRFKDWLEYPAMGLNCGVEPLPALQGSVRIATTWAPRYAQPRIDPTAIAGLPTSYAELSDPNSDVARLLLLPDRYDDWISAQARLDVGVGLPAEIADRERQAHAQDIEAYRRESDYIRAGVQLLLNSRSVARDVAGRAPFGSWSTVDARAAPWEAWLLTNEAFAKYGGARFTDWRLFQLAFILAHVPTLASRMPEYADRFNADRDELSASLLYFATGGGKSEAFFGLVIFNLFLDRLRGKERGVTALIRYPLRLLTLQQARRLMRILAKAELVKLRRRIPGAPFEIGFWVGSGNTPNRAAQGFGGVPAITLATYATDVNLLNPPQGDTEADRAARRRSERYKETLESYDKLRTCPCCGQATGMRRYPSQDRRIGIVCFNDACDWN